MTVKVFAAGEVLRAADLNTYLMYQAVPVFASKAVLDAGWTSPPNGAQAFTTDTNTHWVRILGAWRPFPDKGSAVATVDGTGRTPAISHQVGAVPSLIFATPLAGNGSQVLVESRTATTFNLRLWQSNGSAATGSVTVAWQAWP